MLDWAVDLTLRCHCKACFAAVLDAEFGAQAKWDTVRAPDRTTARRWAKELGWRFRAGGKHYAPCHIAPPIKRKENATDDD